MFNTPLKTTVESVMKNKIVFVSANTPLYVESRRVGFLSTAPAGSELCKFKRVRSPQRRSTKVCCFRQDTPATLQEQYIRPRPLRSRNCLRGLFQREIGTCQAVKFQKRFVYTPHLPHNHLHPSIKTPPKTTLHLYPHQFHLLHHPFSPDTTPSSTGIHSHASQRNSSWPSMNTFP